MYQGAFATAFPGPTMNCGVDSKKREELRPDLRKLASQRTLQHARESVNVLRQRVLSTLNGQQLSLEEPFLGNLTLEDYHALSEQEKSRLWNGWTDTDLVESDEHEVNPNAVPA